MLKKIAKILLKTVLVIFVLINGVILCTGRFYLYKAISTTYLSGKRGPSSTEYQIFENRKIAALSPKKWPVSPKYNSVKLDEKYEALMKEVKTHAFLIIKNDTIVHEQYWDGFSDTSHTNSFSMAKSFTSALLGVAIKEGFIKSIDEPVNTYIPEFKKDWRSKITLKHVATMSSGIGFDESYGNPFSYPAEGYYSTDLMAATLKYTKQVSEPGTVFNYLSGNTTLMGYCISKAVGKPLATYLGEKLWTPMGCENDAYWSIDKNDGLEKAFCCINSNIRDFARIGKLYMHQGNWEGIQLIDSAYVNQSIIPFDGLEVDGSKNRTYGYSWWLTENKGLRIFYMRGMLNQFVICIPQKNMIVCKLSGKRRAKNKEHTPTEVAYCIDAALSMYDK